MPQPTGPDRAEPRRAWSSAVLTAMPVSLLAVAMAIPFLTEVAVPLRGAGFTGSDLVLLVLIQVVATGGVTAAAAVARRCLGSRLPPAWPLGTVATAVLLVAVHVVSSSSEAATFVGFVTVNVLFTVLTWPGWGGLVRRALAATVALVPAAVLGFLTAVAGLALWGEVAARLFEVAALLVVLDRITFADPNGLRIFVPAFAVGHVVVFLAGALAAPPRSH